jgi:hypothetical protein
MTWQQEVKVCLEMCSHDLILELKAIFSQKKWLIKIRDDHVTSKVFLTRYFVTKEYGLM